MKLGASRKTPPSTRSALGRRSISIVLNDEKVCKSKLKEPIINEFWKRRSAQEGVQDQ